MFPSITGTLTGPSLGLHDVHIDQDVTIPFKTRNSKEFKNKVEPVKATQYFVQETIPVVQQQPRFDLLDCLVCWYCPGVFILSRLFCPPPTDTVIGTAVVNRPVY